METDSPEDAVMTIFKSVQNDLNDFNVNLQEPNGSVFLDSYKDIDPNDMKKMLIEQKLNFFRGNLLQDIEKVQLCT